MIGIIVFFAALVAFQLLGRRIAQRIPRVKLMITFITILGLHVMVISGVCVYHLMHH